MTNTVANELEKANAHVLELHVSLGQALLDDDQKAIAKVTKELTEAQALQAQLEQKNSSIGLAQQHSVTIAEERAAKAAQDALEKQIDEAGRDLEGLRLAARKVDKALAAFDAALFDLGEQADSYVDKHDNLGIDGGTKSYLRGRSWNVEVLAHFIDKGETHFGRFLRGKRILAYGRRCSIETTIPKLSEVLSGKMTGRPKG